MDELSLDEQLKILRRGTLEIISEKELKGKLAKSVKSGKPLKIKLGVDPTASAVTLGWAVQLRKLRDFQRLGHQACLIVGDFTAMIGDPSGKSKTRKQLDRETVDQYINALMPQFYKILIPEKTTLYHNSEWLGKMNFSEVIKLTAKTTVARILEREDFTNRLEKQQPLHLHEILYPLCQGQDSVAIESDVELGGNDQKFNNLVGRDLQGHSGQDPQVVILTPLLVGTDGVEKMSQSLSNYIGITEEPSQIFGKVMSIPDESIINYFELATDVSNEEITQIASDLASGAAHPMTLKRRLGREIVTLYHDADSAIKAEESFNSLYSKRETPKNIEELSIPSALINDNKVFVHKLLAELNLVESAGAAKRLIVSGGLEINGEKIKSLDPIDINKLSNTTIKIGKHKWIKLKV